jgi:hypothetical protein
MALLRRAKRAFALIVPIPFAGSSCCWFFVFDDLVVWSSAVSLWRPASQRVSAVA